jgi:dCMP deaminase
MKNRMKNFYMSVAEQCAMLSRARRLQVGSVIVKNDNIISFSWNGMPAGWNNDCEDRVWMDCDAGGWLDVEDIERRWPYEEYSDEDPTALIGRYNWKSKPEVLHAERNALDKLAKGNEGGLGATMFVTVSPCLECAKSIYGAGIKEVYYKYKYRSDDGIIFLKKCGIGIEQILS